MVKDTVCIIYLHCTYLRFEVERVDGEQYDQVSYQVAVVCGNALPGAWESHPTRPSVRN